MKSPHPDDSRITERAAEWLVILDEGGYQEQEAFAAWLGESARHIEEFLFVSTVCKEFGSHFPHKWAANVERILAAAQSNIVVLQEDNNPQRITPATTSQERKLSRRWALAAALAGVAIAAGWAIATYPQWYGYSTVVGEQRAFELNDGSVIHLNTHSRVKVNITATQREVRLLTGEALFRVARDMQRPFRVHVGDSTIQAVGTQFNIYRRSQKIVVSVIEGSVRISRDESARVPDAGVRTGEASAPVPGAVSVGPGKEAGMERPLILAAGEGANIAADGHITRQRNVDAIKVSAWRQRRLVFVDDRLADVAAEFNRYNRMPQLHVTEAAGKTLLSGVFDADDPESMLLFVQGIDGLSIDRTGGEITVRSRQ